MGHRLTLSDLLVNDLSQGMMISLTSNYTESRDFFKINLTLIDTSIRVKEIINFKDSLESLKNLRSRIILFVSS